VFAEKLMASEDIQTVQELLEEQGYNPGIITGTITPDTRKALRRFQAHHHLHKSGELDCATQDKVGVFVRMVESDPVLGVTQEARAAANNELLVWEAAHPNAKKRQPGTVRAKPTKP
jgi:peptidoglycan hydrolase-like protein with peptidoglycan-binding domain